MKGTFCHRPSTVAQLVFNHFFCPHNGHYKIVIIIKEKLQMIVIFKKSLFIIIGI